MKNLWQVLNVGLNRLRREKEVVKVIKIAFGGKNHTKIPNKTFIQEDYDLQANLVQSKFLSQKLFSKENREIDRDRNIDDRWIDT